MDTMASRFPSPGRGRARLFLPSLSEEETQVYLSSSDMVAEEETESDLARDNDMVASSRGPQTRKSVLPAPNAPPKSVRGSDQGPRSTGPKIQKKEPPRDTRAVQRAPVPMRSEVPEHTLLTPNPLAAQSRLGAFRARAEEVHRIGAQKALSPNATFMLSSPRRPVPQALGSSPSVQGPRFALPPVRPAQSQKRLADSFAPTSFPADDSGASRRAMSPTVTVTGVKRRPAPGWVYGLGTLVAGLCAGAAAILFMQDGGAKPVSPAAQPELAQVVFEGRGIDRVHLRSHAAASSENAETVQDHDVSQPAHAQTHVAAIAPRATVVHHAAKMEAPKPETPKVDAPRAIKQAAIPAPTPVKVEPKAKKSASELNDGSELIKANQTQQSASKVIDDSL